MLKVNVHRCNRCKHEWAGKIENPKTCANPKCRTPYWNKPRVRKKIKVKQDKRFFYFDFERENGSKSYSFEVVDNEIECEECKNKTCNHVFEIMSNPKIREKIASQGIKFSAQYEKEIKELEKNVKSLTEFVEYSKKEN